PLGRDPHYLRLNLPSAIATRPNAGRAHPAPKLKPQPSATDTGCSAAIWGRAADERYRQDLHCKRHTTVDTDPANGVNCSGDARRWIATGRESEACRRHWGLG